ncbi:MAG: hypothetical protein ABSF09_11740, partial [Candidatus Bathyarchaeia archaeon]
TVVTSCTPPPTNPTGKKSKHTLPTKRSETTNLPNQQPQPGPKNFKNKKLTKTPPNQQTKPTKHHKQSKATSKPSFILCCNDYSGLNAYSKISM